MREIFPGGGVSYLRGLVNVGAIVWSEGVGAVGHDQVLNLRTTTLQKCESVPRRARM